MNLSAADLVIVGAGPAGMAAAVEATRRGVSTLVLDENNAAGGRIWQALERRGAKDDDEADGLALIGEFSRCGATIRYGAGVWGIEPGAESGKVFWSSGGTAHGTTSGRILLATGTTERPLPIPGWTLPGVMTVGAAQVALKTGGLVPDGATWIAGQGPLTVLYAAQAIRAGGTIAGIIDLSAPSARWRALRHLPAAFGDVLKGIGWFNELRAARVRIIRGRDVRAMGDTTLRGISFHDGKEHRTEAADLLLLHDGVIPNIHITRALGCRHVWDAAQRCWHPETDAWGETSLPGVSVAGDGARVAGASAAVFSGQIAALGCAHALRRIDTAARDRAAAPLRAGHARAIASRPFIDTLYAPLPVVPDGDTLVCRCEEVTAGAIRAAAAIGCQGLNQLKAYTRCGMGPCQGRMCGATAGAVLARAMGLPPSAVEPFRTRFPARPLTVGELALLEH